jgi:excisionase family DNA binding protein
MTTPLANRLMTIRDLQDYLKVSRTTVFRLMRDGRLTRCRVGGQIRFRPTDVDRFVRDCRVNRSEPQ